MASTHPQAVLSTSLFLNLECEEEELPFPAGSLNLTKYTLRLSQVPSAMLHAPGDTKA